MSTATTSPCISDARPGKVPGCDFRSVETSSKASTVCHQAENDWWSSTSRAAEFQALTMQLGLVAPDSPPGSPDMVTTRLCPSWLASLIERRMSSACLSPITLFGCSGFPLQFSPVIDTPVPSKSARRSSRAASLARMTSKVGNVDGWEESARIVLYTGEA